MWWCLRQFWTFNSGESRTQKPWFHYPVSVFLAESDSVNSVNYLCQWKTAVCSILYSNLMTCILTTFLNQVFEERVEILMQVIYNLHLFFFNLKMCSYFSQLCDNLFKSGACRDWLKFQVLWRSFIIFVWPFIQISRLCSWVILTVAYNFWLSTSQKNIKLKQWFLIITVL